jgi:hypothetical protein
MPEISLTANMVPFKLLVTENSCPGAPSMDIVPDSVGYANKVTVCAVTLAFAPEKAILGSLVVLPLCGVITMFLSVCAIGVIYSFY